MRLLPKDKARQQIDDFRASLIEERNALSSDIASLTKERNDLRRSLVEEKDRLIRDTSDLTLQMEKKRDEIRLEVLSLEERKKEALKPVTERLQLAEAAEKRAKEQQEAVLSMARKFGEEKSAFVERLATCVDRENVLKEQEEAILYRLDRLREAELLNKKSTDALTQKWIEFRTKEAERNDVFEEKNGQISLEKALIEKDKAWCLQERQEIALAKERIASDRQTLKAAFDEGRKKGYL